MVKTEGKGSHAARRANAAEKDGKTDPRQFSEAQAILGGKGGETRQ